MTDAAATAGMEADVVSAFKVFFDRSKDMTAPSGRLDLPGSEKYRRPGCR